MQRLSRHTPQHYVSSASHLSLPPECCVPGSKNLLFLGEGKSQIYRGPALQGGVSGGRVMFPLTDGGYASLGDASTQGIGSIVGLIARAFAFVGSGPVYLNGVTRSVSATTAAQMILYRAGSFSGANTGPYVMGLSRPTAPTIAVTPTVNTEMSGTVSIVIWFVRSVTGGRSRASLPSAVLVVDGKKVRLTIPSGDLTTASNNGYDRIGIGVSRFGYGFAGPHYEYRDAVIDTEIAISSLTTVDGVANSYELSWTDASLAGQALAPSLDFTPPAFVYMGALEDVLFGVGAYGDATSGVSSTSPGTAIVYSLPVFIESFPPDNILFLPEAPTGALSRAAEGFCFVLCKNSLHVLFYTGGRNTLSLRTIWPNVGFVAQHNAFLGEGGQLVGFSSGKRGLVRIGREGEPETAWAADVADDTRNWVAANVIGGYDGDHTLEIFGHDKTLLCFNPSARGGQGAWSTPLDLTGKITGSLCACVTVGGGLLLAANDGSTIRLYNFNGGTGTVAEVFFPEQFVDAESASILRLRVAFRGDPATFLRLKLFRNGNPVPAYDSGSLAPAGTGKQLLPTRKPDVRCARTYQAYLQMTGTTNDDYGPDLVELRGEVSNITLSGVAA
jgi:hypothetical protein